jgi:hypothetical protein
MSDVHVSGALAALAGWHEQPVSGLAQHALVQPGIGDDVEAAVVEWMAEMSMDPLGIARLYDDPAIVRLPLRQRALLDLLWLIEAAPGRWMARYGCLELAERLKEIERQLAPCRTTLDRLASKARAFVATGVEHLLDAPDRLLSFLDGERLRIDAADTVVLPFGAAISLGDLVEGVGRDGIALWHLRELFDEKGAVDAALRVRRDDIAPGLILGLKRLFDAGTEPGPVDYVAAFAQVLEGTDWLTVILRELRRREELTDGFDLGSSPDEWLRSVEAAGSWRTDDIRRLARLERLFDRAPAAFISAMASGVRAIGAKEHESVSFAAFGLLHLARRSRIASARLVDANHERNATGIVRDLTGGHDILAVHELLSVLPTGVRGERCAWPYLGRGEKGVWRCRVRERVGQDASLCLGLAEFLLTWTVREAYPDVERLVVELLPGDRTPAILDAWAMSIDPITVLRAGCLKRDLPLERED